MKQHPVVQTIIHAPAYLTQFVLSFAVSILREINITAAAIAAASFGAWLDNAWFGLGIFFVLYFLVRTMNGVTGIGKAIIRAAYAVQQQPTPQETPQPDHNE